MQSELNVAACFTEGPPQNMAQEPLIQLKRRRGRTSECDSSFVVCAGYATTATNDFGCAVGTLRAIAFRRYPRLRSARRKLAWGQRTRGCLLAPLASSGASCLSTSIGERRGSDYRLGKFGSLIKSTSSRIICVLLEVINEHMGTTLLVSHMSSISVSACLSSWCHFSGDLVERERLEHYASNSP